MDFGLTDEQRALDASVRDYLRDRFDLAAVRKVYDDAEGDGHSRELWSAFAEYGWLAVTVPEEHDGLGLGILDAQVVARALGAGAVPGPWLPTVLATEAIRLAGSAEQQAAWLPKLAAGEVVGTVSLEPPAAGALRRVEYGAVADLLVVATEDGGLGLAELSGATRTPAPQYDFTTRLAAVDLAGVTVEPLPGADTATVADLHRRAAVLAAADLVGTSREALTRTVAYDKERVQFGKPVGSFQALKHSMADLHVGVTMAEHAVLYAAFAIDKALTDNPRDDMELACAVAKAKASDVAKQTTSAMIQYHGGIGFTWEHDSHFYFKRAKRLAASYGDLAQSREKIAALTFAA
jgi:alkylation response protein AidB-like acyl-CoA dehydrogenase